MAKNNGKLYVVMVGLPARGKSTVANKLMENLSREGFAVRIFNNGDLRREMVRGDSTQAGFYDPANTEAAALREKIATINIGRARDWIAGEGQIAILDSTNVSRRRRDKVRATLTDHPVLFIECVNTDADLVSASITQKTKLPEFEHMGQVEAYQSFTERVRYYEAIYEPFRDEANSITVDTLNCQILAERLPSPIPHYGRLRDLLVSDWVRSLFLVRHGETHYNLENRIGGNSSLTDRGKAQAEALAAHFAGVAIPYIFTSTRRRTLQMALPMLRDRPETTLVPLHEFDEIDGGVCEHMTYEEIGRTMPEVAHGRAQDKYNYVYPGGEGYVTLQTRVYKGIKKALYLSAAASNIMIIGHQAVNRAILSHFLFRRTEDVPYIFIPQNKYFHVVSTQNRKLFELEQFMD
ncbi:MAG: histidine phosphatase family protein [Desulfovibrionaceae bacterium]|jgi:broad specificity phosphatase PhoE/predicted kinase|nr:histidine phosphatase family protein [Desulfovibrionaceae bacterium]